MSNHTPTLRLSSFYFAYYAALGAFTPYWSLFLKDRGYDAAVIGVLMSLWYGTRIIAPSTWSWLAGRSAQPIWWLRLGCAATLISFIAFFAPLGFISLFVAMSLFCFFCNAVMPQFEAITFSHLTGQSERYGRIRVWGSIGFIVVVALFGLVFDYLPISALPWLMLPLYAGLLASSFSNDYGQATARQETTTGFQDCLKRREVLAFFLIAFLMQISFGPYYTFFSIYLQEHGYHSSALGAYWAIGVAVEIAVFFFASRVLTRWNAAHLIFIALVFASLRWWVTALFPENIPLMVVAQVTHAISFAVFSVGCMQLMAHFFPGRLNGHGQGVFYGFSSGVGGVLGALITGHAWQIGGGQLAFLIAGGVSAFAALIAWKELRPEHIGAR